MKSKILDLFQSVEMKKYIDDNFDNLTSYQINDIICGSRISLEDKLEILNELKETDKIYENSYNAIIYALSHLKLKDNEIFILKANGIDDENLKNEKITYSVYEHSPFNCYDKAIKYQPKIEIKLLN